MSELLFDHEPSLEDVIKIHDEIQVHQSAITSIDEEIQAMLRAMYLLRDQRARHEERIRQCKSVITLARRLPAEVMANIFIHCAEAGWVRAPLVVSMVCSSWRFAARNYPRVWSHVHISCEDNDPISKTRYWLAMARQAPLHVTVVAGIETSELPDIMDVLLDRASQWRSFSVIAPRLRHANYLLSRCTHALPELSAVSVTTQVDLDEVMPVGNTELDGFRGSFEDAPHLTTLNLTCNALHTTGVIPAQIQNLSLNLRCADHVELPVSGSSLLQLLGELPLLKQFAMTFPPDYQPPYIPEGNLARTVIIPYLESIVLCVPPDFNGLLAHIRAPRLRTLQLRSNQDPSGRPHDLTGASLREFLEQSNPPLELLELHDVDLADDDYVHCFVALNSLRELRLHESEIADGVVRLLNGPRGYCPRLALLDLRWCGHLRGKTLVDLVRSRLVDDHPSGDISDPISEVAVMNCCFVEEQDVLDLAAMTVCRLVLRETEDYCRFKGCCMNARYRQRLRLRHNIGLPRERLNQIRLVL